MHHNRHNKHNASTKYRKKICPKILHPIWCNHFLSFEKLTVWFCQNYGKKFQLKICDVTSITLNSSLVCLNLEEFWTKINRWLGKELNLDPNVLVDRKVDRGKLAMCFQNTFLYYLKSPYWGSFQRNLPLILNLFQAWVPNNLQAWWKNSMA